MLEYNEIYSSIIKEFQLSPSDLEQMKEAVEDLTKSRMNICNLLKVQKLTTEVLASKEKELAKSININISNIEDCEKKRIELKDKIKLNKQEIKVIKLQVNKLEDKLIEAQQESRKLREALSIFLSREKFKFVKNLLISKYRKVFFQYHNDLNIKTKIMKCSERKEAIRQEKQILNNGIERCNRKIIVNRIALAEMRKSITSMQKSIDFLTMKLKALKDYKEVEKKFKLQTQK